MNRVARSWATKALIAAGVLAATVAALVVVPAAEGGANSAGSALGVYVGYQAPGTVKAFGQSIGAQPPFAMDFLDGDSWSALVDSAPSYMAAWKGSGYSMIWGVPILPNNSQYSLADGAAGDYNSYFQTLAQDMVAGGQGSSIVRIGWEFNGGWFPWAANGQAAAFIGYWQQIVNTMRSVAGQNFKFEWNPTAGDLGVGNLANYYPGNAYVDYVGLDVYDQNWAVYPGAAAEFSNIETMGYGLDWLSSFATSQGKPIVLPEWGLGQVPGNGGQPTSADNAQTSGGDNPTFINDMAQWIEANDVYEASYWQFGISALSPSSNPNSFAAFVNDFGSGSTSTPTTSTPSTSTPTTSTPSTSTPTTSTPTTSTPSTSTPDTSTPTTSTPDTSTSPSTSDATAPPKWTRHHHRRGWYWSRSTVPSPSTSAAFPGTATGDTTVSLEGPTSTVVTGRGAFFRAYFSNASPGGPRPWGQASWSITGASGTTVPCMRGNDDDIRRSGVITCVVARQQLDAADSPYTVSVNYAGGNGFTAAAATLMQPVAPANSQTWMNFTPASSSGGAFTITASVSGQTAWAVSPTGSVTFDLLDSSGQTIACQGGDTVPLSAGQASCSLGSASSQAVLPITVTATYGGDSNFDSSMSQVGTINGLSQ